MTPVEPRTGEYRRGRGRPATISQGSIVTAGLEVARTSGFASVTLASVARRVGTSHMALYRHVRDKASMLSLVADAALGEVELPSDRSISWIDRVQQITRNTRAVVQRYPGLAAFLYSQQPVASQPHGLRIANATFECLFDAGLSEAEAALAFASTRALSIGLLNDGPDRRRRGPSPLRAALRVVPAGELTAVRRVVDELARLGAEEQFEFAMTCYLQGLEATVATRASQSL